MKPQESVLVVGGVHLDMVAEYEASGDEGLDRQGKSVRISLGGAGYNVAANLARNRCPVQFFTFVKRDSLSARIIKNHLETKGISTNLIQESGDVGESGYVAHWRQNSLERAVSVSSFDQASFDERTSAILKRAIESCRFIAVDTNLTLEQLREVVRLARLFGKQICVTSVSEIKVLRLRALIDSAFDFKFTLISLNEREAYALGVAPLALVEKGEALRKDLKADQLVITQGERGYLVFEPSSHHQFDPFVPARGTAHGFGAGDALFAGACKALYYQKRIDFRQCHAKEIQTSVLPVLDVHEATPGASILSDQQSDSRALFSLLLFSFSILGFVTAAFLATDPFSMPILNLVLFTLSAMFAGGSGSIAAILHARDTQSPVKDLLIRDVSLGMFAGFVTVLLLILAPAFLDQITVGNLARDIQSLTTNTRRFDGTGTVLPLFAFFVAVVSGFGFDKVFLRLKSADPLGIGLKAEGKVYED